MNDTPEPGYWRGRPLSQTPSAIRCRAIRAALNEKDRQERLALDSAKAKLTPDEWQAVSRYFETVYCCQ